MAASIPFRRAPFRPRTRGSGSGRVAVALVALPANGLLAGALLLRGHTAAFAVALLPLLLIAAGALVASDRSAVFVAALVLPMSLPQLTSSLPFGGGHLFAADVIAIVAAGGGLAAWLFRTSRGEAVRWPRTAVLGWPFVLFAVAMVAAILRGHFHYGSSILGQPFRLLLYAGIVGAIVDLSPRKVWRVLVATFYLGTVWMLLSAAYYLATGTSQTTSEDLSTGGSRALSISISMYLAGALFLALLNLQIDREASRQTLHVSVAVLAFVGVVLGYGRAVYGAVAIVLVVFAVLQRRILARALRLLPLLAPLLVIAALVLLRAVPTLVPDLVQRVSASPQNDPNVQWRVKANQAVLQQVRSSPYFGVGFGLGSRFVLMKRERPGVYYPVIVEIDQDPHNGYLFLAAGGGAAALGSFLAIVAAFAFECVRRFRRTRDPLERALLVWCASTLFVFLVDAASGTSFESATDMLTVWLLLVLPSVVPLRRQPSSGS